MLCYHGIYMSVIPSWTLFYLVSSPSLPWTTCGHWWNHPDHCSDGINETSTYDYHYSWRRSTTPEEEFFECVYDSCVTLGYYNDKSWFVFIIRQRVLGMWGFYVLGGFQPDLALALAAAWIILFVCLVKGPMVQGKVHYIELFFLSIYGSWIPNSNFQIVKASVSASFCLVAILAARGLTLPGTYALVYFITPEYYRLLNLQVGQSQRDI